MSQKIYSDLIIRGNITLNTTNPGLNTDKFLVQDSSGKIAFRTGTELLADIGAGTGGGTSDTTYSETPSGLIDGVNFEYTLVNIPTNTASVLVVLDGIIQYNSIDFTVSGHTITFTTPPAIGSTIFAYYNLISGGGGASATNLTYTASPTNGIVLSDTGTDATIPLADVTNAGLLKPADFTQLSNLTSNLSGKQATLSGTGFVKSTAGVISYDTNNYYLASNPSSYTSNLGTVTSVAALTLGTTGTDISSTVATGTITPVITLNIPTASAVNRGALSSTDWSIFNGKQNAIGYTPANILNPTFTDSITVTNAVYASADVGSNPHQLTTKEYVDNAVTAGLHVHTPVRVERHANLPATYVNGGTTPTVTEITSTSILTSVGHNLLVDDLIVFTVSSNGIIAGDTYFIYQVLSADTFTISTTLNGPAITTLINGTGLTLTSRANSGVGATLTNAGTQAALVISTITLIVGDRVLIQNQTNGYENGIYTVTNVGSASTNWVLTRSTDTNKYGGNSPSYLGNGDYFFINEGTPGASESYILTTIGEIVFGTTSLVFTKFSAAPTYTWNTPLSISGQTISILQSGTSTDGYLSLTDWNIFNNKQPALGGTGFVKSTAGVISYDNSTYYLASNPSGYTANTGTVTGTSTIGYVSFWGTTSSIAGSSSLFWDNTNKYLGIGTAGAPATPLHVRSTTSVGLARIQGLGDVDNYSVLELWDDTGASKWQFAHKASTTYPKGFTFAHWNGSSWIQPVVLLDSGRTLIGVGTVDDVVATNLLQVGGYVRASGYRISSGLPTQFLKADGTTDSSTYLTSVGISNLTATGTPSATTYLRGDNTWATVSGGGGGSPGGTVNEVQYNDGAGGFAGAANVEINTGNLKLVSTTDPAVPTGGLIYYSKAIAGRVLPKIIGPSGIDTVMQVGLHGNSVFMISPSNATTAPNVIGGAITTATTISHQQTIASANPWQATRRTRFQTSTTAGNATGARTAYVQWYRGSATGFGGFWFRCQLGMNINLQGGQKFVGLCALTTALAGDPSALLNMCGMGYDAADLSTGSWSFMYNDGTGTATKVNLGANALRNTTSGYDLVMYMAPGGSELFVRITNLDTNVVVLDTSYTTLLPVANTGMAFKAEVRNGAVAAADNLEIAKVYIETDY